ncbi:unnamed protein product, partial [Ixodes pacificus]
MAICKGLLRHPLAFLLLLLLCPRGTPSANPEDNEFAEFEEFDEEEEQKGVPGGPQGAVPLPQKGQEGEDEAGVEEEEAEEFDHFQDEEEFEGLDQDRPVKAKPSGDRPDLTIAKARHTTLSPITCTILHS